MNPTVSAIIPSYNYGRFLAQAINASSPKPIPVLEIIVVDDGSTDNTARSCRRITDNPRIRYVPKENGGTRQYSQLGDFAWPKAHSLPLLDADDVWHPQKIQRQVDFMKNNPDVGVLATGFYHIFDRQPAFDTDEPMRYEEYSVRDFFEFAPFTSERSCSARNLWNGLDCSTKS